MTLIISIIAISVVILIHEFGHFIVCKLSGIYVEEFAIGFGPKLFSIKGKETEYSVRLFWIGGYVKPLGEDKDVDHPRALNNSSVYKRILMVLMGPIMNFVLAIGIMLYFGYAFGFGTNVIKNVEKNMPAYQAGIRPGDKIVKIDNSPIYIWDQVSFELAIHNLIKKDSKLTIDVERNNKIYSFDMFPKYDPITKSKRVGIAPYISQKSFSSSLYYGFVSTFVEIKETLYSLGLMLGGKVSFKEVMGPVGMVKTMGQAANAGFKKDFLSGVINVLWLMQLISVNLGVMNLIPFPALDGSRFIFYLYEAVMGKPFNREKEAMIHTIGFFILLLLIVLITFNDIKNIFILG
ncbi:RIP metalloprotease RseP, partial [Caldicellulosiruptoraceae bacterium PP1]